jgi:hypothetical protein
MFAGIEISWMTAGWAMVVAVYLTLALIYLVIAARSQESGSLAYLLFVAVALGTIEQYASVLRMVHIPLAFLLLPLPWFVYVLFRTGRPWLALLSNALWMAALVINAFSPHSRLYAEITALERIPFAGEAFTRAVGTGHAWRWIGQMTTLVILVFVLDAAVTLWNQGGRRRAVLIGGAQRQLPVPPGRHGVRAGRRGLAGGEPGTAGGAPSCRVAGARRTSPTRL